MKARRMQPGLVLVATELGEFVIKNFRTLYGEGSRDWQVMFPDGGWGGNYRTLKDAKASVGYVVANPEKYGMGHGFAGLGDASERNRGIEIEECEHCGLDYRRFRGDLNYKKAYNEIAWNRDHTGRMAVLRHMAAMKREAWRRHLDTCALPATHVDVDPDDFRDDLDDSWDFGADDGEWEEARD